MLRFVVTLLLFALSATLAGAAHAAPPPGPVYATCGDAHGAGVYDIPRGTPAYWNGGDRDNDGYACDSPGN